MKKISTDILVIGGGPAGMAAALRAKELGINKITIVDRLPELGGILMQCIHSGFGLHKFKQDLTGPEYAGIYANKIRSSDIEILLSTMVLEIGKSNKVIASNKTDGLIEISPRAIILAMGCRERTRQQVSIPGTRPSGIFTAGAAQRFVNIEGYMPGKSVVIVGSGDIGMIMARRMTLEGANVHAVTEILPYPGGLSRNVVQCLEDFDIPLYLGHHVREILGKERVTGVRIQDAATDRIFDVECDTLLFSVGLIPENELSRMVHLEINPLTGGPFMDDNYQTNHPGIFICGNAAFVNDLADYVSIEGETAGESAANYINRQIIKGVRVPVVAGDNVHFITPNFITRKDKAILHMRVKAPMVGARIVSTDDIITRKMQVVKPGEMIEVNLNSEQLEKISMLKELWIDVRKDEPA